MAGGYSENRTATGQSSSQAANSLRDEDGSRGVPLASGGLGRQALGRAVPRSLSLTQDSPPACANPHCWLAGSRATIRDSWFLLEQLAPKSVNIVLSCLFFVPRPPRRDTCPSP